MKTLRVFCAFCVVLGTLGAEAVAQPHTTSSATLTIKASQRSVKIGSSVYIEVTAANKSGHDIVVPREVRGTDSQIEVRDLSGKLADDSKFGYVWNGHVADPDPSQVSVKDLEGMIFTVTVKPGEKLTWHLDAAKFYSMNKPGKYAIIVQKADPENPSVALKSNVVTVTMVP